MESRDREKAKKALPQKDAEDRFVATVADDLRQLPQLERLMAKNEIKNTLFKYQMMVLQNQNQNMNPRQPSMQRQMQPRQNILRSPGNGQYSNSAPLATNFGNPEDVTFSNTNSNVQQNDFQSPERGNFSFNGSTPTHNFRTPENGNFQSTAQSPSFSPSPSYPPPNAAYGNSTLDQQYQQ